MAQFTHLTKTTATSAAVRQYGRIKTLCGKHTGWFGAWEATPEVAQKIDSLKYMAPLCPKCAVLLLVAEV